MQKIIHKSIILGLAVVVLSCSVNAHEEKAETKLQVEAYKVVAQPFNNEVVTTANLMPNEQVELMAPVAGQVLEIYFKEGQKVTKGEIIIRLDDRSWKAQLIGVRAQLEAAQKDFERKKALLAIGGSSNEEIERTYSSVESLKSQVEQLKVNIELANVSAPFSGQLGMRDFSTGAFLSQGDIITTLTEMDQLKVDFTLVQAHRESIAVGKNVLVLVSGDTLSATIYAINPLVDAQTRTIHVRALLKQSRNKPVMPGTFAEVLITTDFVKDALLVPTQAIVPSINEQTVYINRGGKAVRKVIRMGNRTADRVHILDGIAVGDTVLTTGLLSVKEGMELTFLSVKE